MRLILECGHQAAPSRAVSDGYTCRPTGKRSIPEPNGAPPRLGSGKSTMMQQFKAMPGPTAKEPGMPALGRPSGCTILRESDQVRAFILARGQPRMQTAVLRVSFSESHHLMARSNL
jgi:hypothetical protein